MFGSYKPSNLARGVARICLVSCHCVCSREFVEMSERNNVLDMLYFCGCMSETEIFLVRYGK